MNATARVGTRRGWYHGWNIVGVTILTQIAANGMAINANSLFLRKFSEDMHAPISSFLLGLMGVEIVSSLLAPFVGKQADNFPARSLLLAGLVGLGVPPWRELHDRAVALHRAVRVRAGAVADAGRFAGHQQAGFGLVRAQPGAGAGAVGALIVAFGHGQPALIVGVLLVGVNGGMWPLMASAISREFGSAHFGSAFGMLMLFVLLDVIAPVGVAVIKERTGSYVPGLAVLVGLTIVAGFVSLMLRERARGDADADVPVFA